MRSQLSLATLVVLALIGLAAVAAGFHIGSDMSVLERPALVVAGLASIGFVSRRRRRD